MGLFIVSGTMGGGKSYFLAEIAKKCWEDGGVVHGNMEWHRDEIERRGWLDRLIELPANPERWVTKTKVEDGEDELSSDWIIGGTEGAENLVIIDEASRKFHMFDQQANRARNRAIFDLAIMSRQVGIDIYFLAQNANNIDVAIRGIAESQIRCINVERIPFLGRILAWFMGTFRRVWLSPLKSEIQVVKYARFDSEIASLYKTHGQGDKIKMKRSERAQVQPNKPRVSWFAVCALVLFLALIILGGCHLMKKSSSLAAEWSGNPPAAVTGDSLPRTSVKAESVDDAVTLIAAFDEPPRYISSDGILYCLGPCPGAVVVDRVENSETAVTLYLGPRTVAVLHKQKFKP